MAFYGDEEEVWKCSKHPSKRRRTGVCHVCLRERLSSLCPDCANVRPCACYTATSSYSSSFSLSRFSAASDEPSFRRSRSVAVSFLRSKPSVEEKDSTPKTMSLWKMLKSGMKSKRHEAGEDGVVLDESNEERRRMMKKSRSVAVTSELRGGDVRVGKGRGWHFPSPIKALKQSISRGILHENSPLQHHTQ